MPEKANVGVGLNVVEGPSPSRSQVRDKENRQQLGKTTDNVVVDVIVVVGVIVDV